MSAAMTDADRQARLDAIELRFREDAQDWHRDEVASLLSELERVERERDLARATERAMVAAVVGTVGGIVEGAPTGSLNYLQRLRELCQRERDLAAAQAREAQLLGLNRDICEALRSETEAFDYYVENGRKTKPGYTQETWKRNRWHIRPVGPDECCAALAREKP